MIQQMLLMSTFCLEDYKNTENMLICQNVNNQLVSQNAYIQIWF